MDRQELLAEAKNNVLNAIADFAFIGEATASPLSIDEINGVNGYVMKWHDFIENRPPDWDGIEWDN